MIKSALSALKLFKLVLVIIACIAIISALSGCRSSAKLNALHVSFYRDPVTGVNYVIYNNDHGSSIYPRFNADGTLFVEEKGDEDD